MRCPKCNSLAMEVLDRRGPKRRRKWLDCNYRFTTVEIIVGDTGFHGAGNALEKVYEAEAKKRLVKLARQAAGDTDAES